MTTITTDIICALCQKNPHDIILWEDNFCRVVLLNDTDYPAYCRVELIEHVREMTDLSANDRARTMDIVFAVETAIREVLQPEKVNLASLGNKTPHIHWHIIPRFEDDKHFPNSHWGEAVRPGQIKDISETELANLKEKIHRYAMRALLGQNS